MDKADNPFLATLRLPVKKSPALHNILIILYFICIILPWMTGLSLSIKIMLMSAPIISLIVYLYGHRLYKNKKQAKELILNADDNWQVKMDNDVVHQAKLDHRLFVHPWLTILTLFFDNRREVFIFTPEILDADHFRRLRVRLRFKVGD